jgi:hypothetical protein
VGTVACFTGICHGNETWCGVTFKSGVCESEEFDLSSGLDWGSVSGECGKYVYGKKEHTEFEQFEGTFSDRNYFYSKNRTIDGTTSEQTLVFFSFFLFLFLILLRLSLSNRIVLWYHVGFYGFWLSKINGVRWKRECGRKRTIYFHFSQNSVLQATILDF